MIVARSSGETEYRTVAVTINELLWISYLLTNLQETLTGPVDLFYDNKPTIQMLKNPTHHERTKHIDINCHFVRDQGRVQSLYTESRLQLADLFTKALWATMF